MVTKRPAVAAALMAAFNGFLVLYMVGWIAGVSELRQFSDWRGPLFAFFLAMVRIYERDFRASDAPPIASDRAA